MCFDVVCQFYLYWKLYYCVYSQNASGKTDKKTQQMDGALVAAGSDNCCHIVLNVWHVRLWFADICLGTIQREVTVHRKENGYGLQIRGKSPFYVISSVKDGSAAAAAGIIGGEQLIKVSLILAYIIYPNAKRIN